MAHAVWIQGSLPRIHHPACEVFYSVRINGSAVESLFSRFKYDAGGNLSATNSESAVSQLLTADAVSGVHREESAYRKNELQYSSQAS